jgi:hypothetical protein
MRSAISLSENLNTLDLQMSVGDFFDFAQKNFEKCGDKFG